MNDDFRSGELFATAHGITYYKNWSHIWDHSSKAVKPASVAWNDPDNDAVQLRVNPVCDGPDIEVDAGPRVAWSNPNNAVM